MVSDQKHIIKDLSKKVTMENKSHLIFPKAFETCLRMGISSKIEAFLQNMLRHIINIPNHCCPNVLYSRQRNLLIY